MDGMSSRVKAINPSKCVFDIVALIIDVEYKRLAFIIYTDGTNKN